MNLTKTIEILNAEGFEVYQRTKKGEKLVGARLFHKASRMVVDVRKEDGVCVTAHITRPGNSAGFFFGFPDSPMLQENVAKTMQATKIALAKVDDDNDQE